MDPQLKQNILEEIAAASEQHPYEAVDVLWVALVKIANSFPGSNEHRRMLAMVESMPSEAVQSVLDSPAIDKLLNLDPPLETVLVDQHERLQPDATEMAIETIRSKRNEDPKAAVIALGEATSAAVDLGDWTYAGFVLPSSWTTTATLTPATLTFQVSRNNSDWGNLYTENGSEITLFATANYHLSFGTVLDYFRPWRYIKIRNGTAAAPGTQAAARTIYFVTK